MASLSSDAPPILNPSTTSTHPDAPKPLNILQPDRIELTPYGDFPHPLGLTNQPNYNGAGDIRNNDFCSRDWQEQI
jgi:hypothetical protein